MLDIKLLRRDPDGVRQALARRDGGPGGPTSQRLDAVLALDVRTDADAAARLCVAADAPLLKFPPTDVRRLNGLIGAGRINSLSRVDEIIQA